MKCYRRLFLALVLALGVSTVGGAQVLAGKPGHGSFGYADADFALLTSVHLDLFSCVTLTAAGVCTTIPTPNVPGVDVPVALITSPAGQLQGGLPLRQFDLTVAPIAAVLAALPLKQAYEATITATVSTDTAGTLGTSPRSNYTVPFFPVLDVPATPGAFSVQ
jgi:hypothetical protein